MKQGQKNYYIVLSNSNYYLKKKQEPNPNLRNSPDTNANANAKYMAHLLLPALDINVTLTPSLAHFDLPL